jgi:hypothetical protein
MHFINIEKTYNWAKPYPPIEKFPWLSLSYASLVSLNEITPANVAQLHSKLYQDQTLLMRYLSFKAGFNPDVPEEYEQAMNMYEEFGILTSKNLYTYPYLCLMYKSVFSAELQECYQKNKPTAAMRVANRRHNHSKKDPRDILRTFLGYPSAEEIIEDVNLLDEDFVFNPLNRDSYMLD